MMTPTIAILDHGCPLQLDFAALCAYHGGCALAGAAIGFQAMAAAGCALSAKQTWDRQDLQVVSWHDGPGVQDAIEWVTRAITRGRYRHATDAQVPNCSSSAAFRFEVADSKRRVRVQLREGIIPPRFFALASLQSRCAEQVTELSELKSAVSSLVMATSIEQLFMLEVLEPVHA